MKLHQTRKQNLISISRNLPPNLENLCGSRNVTFLPNPLLQGVFTKILVSRANYLGYHAHYFTLTEDWVTISKNWFINKDILIILTKIP